MSGADLGLVVSVFLASAVEFVEALTIVLAMGVTRGWRSALAGTGAALLALAVIAALAGFALAEWLPEALLQLVIGTLLLIFGLQWLRKAILRAAGLKALHDEDEAFREELEAGRAAGRRAAPRARLVRLRRLLQGRLPRGAGGRLHRHHLRAERRQRAAAAVGARSPAAIVLTIGAVAHRPLADVPAEHDQVRGRPAALHVRHVLGRRRARMVLGGRRERSPGRAATSRSCSCSGPGRPSRGRQSGCCGGSLR